MAVNDNRVGIGGTCAVQKTRVSECVHFENFSTLTWDSYPVPDRASTPRSPGPQKGSAATPPRRRYPLNGAPDVLSGAPFTPPGGVAPLSSTRLAQAFPHRDKRDRSLPVPRIVRCCARRRSSLSSALDEVRMPGVHRVLCGPRLLIRQNLERCSMPQPRGRVGNCYG